MDRGLWWGTDNGVAESGMTERLRTALIVVFINISLLFLAEYYSMVWMYCSLFIHSPIKGHGIVSSF